MIATTTKSSIKVKPFRLIHKLYHYRKILLSQKYYPLSTIDSPDDHNNDSKTNTVEHNKLKILIKKFP